ncbi:MAG: hypothetical protein ABIO79_03755 [Ferruginibacter sp.]
MLSQEFKNEAIDILLKVKDHIADNSDCIWTYYETPQQMRDDIDKYILELGKGSTSLLDEMYMHFLPTAAYQEHSLMNNWTVEYHKLAARFDKIYDALKNSN